MAIALDTLIDPLRREVSPPGADLFPEASDDAYLGSLTDAFWEVRLFGFLAGFEENVAARGGPDEFGEGIVTPIGALAGYDAPDGYAVGDLARELQQLIVLWAGYKIALTRLSNLNSLFRAKAGPVEYETQQSATVLKGLLDALKARIDYVLENLGSYGRSPDVVAFDALIERTYSQAVGDTWWVK